MHTVKCLTVNPHMRACTDTESHTNIHTQRNIMSVNAVDTLKS